MKKTIAIATGLLLATGVFASKAQAQTADVPFSGTLGQVNSCTLSNELPGTLAVLNTDPQTISSHPTFATGAALGQVTLNCDLGSANVSVDAPVAGNGLVNPGQKETIAYLDSLGETGVLANSGSPSGLPNSLEINSAGVDQVIYIEMKDQTLDLNFNIVISS